MYILHGIYQERVQVCMQKCGGTLEYYVHVV